MSVTAKIILALILYLISLLIASCASSDPVLYQHTLSFQLDAAQHGHTITLEDMQDINWHNEPKGIAGSCHPFKDQLTGKYTYQIRVAEVVRHRYTEAQIRAVVYHELGHCALRLGHLDKHEFPSIMYPVIQYSDFYERNWPILVDILFTEGK